eukprot:symbB.v1.2.003766.t1/scaffold207.1/size268535/13
MNFMDDSDEYMDATLQINAFGLSAGCTLSLDNVPNQLAVLGHFRAMLEMCQNQIEGDPEQEDSLREVENQLRTVKLMIKCAQARRKAVKVEVMPCILSTSLNQQHDSSEASSLSLSMSPQHSSRCGGRGRRLPKLEGDQSDELQAIRDESQLKEEPSSKFKSERSNSSKEKGMPTNSSSGGREAAKEKQVPTPPTSGSSFSRYLPSFLRKVRYGSKDKDDKDTPVSSTEVAASKERRMSDQPVKSQSIIDELDLEVKPFAGSCEPGHWQELMQATWEKRQVSC